MANEEKATVKVAVKRQIAFPVLTGESKNYTISVGTGYTFKNKEGKTRCAELTTAFEGSDKNFYRYSDGTNCHQKMDICRIITVKGLSKDGKPFINSKVLEDNQKFTSQDLIKICNYLELMR